MSRTVKLPFPNPEPSVSVPSPPRASATKLGWFALFTSAFTIGSRGLRTQRLVHHSLDPVWNSSRSGPLVGQSVNCQVIARGYSPLSSSA